MRRPYFLSSRRALTSERHILLSKMVRRGSSRAVPRFYNPALRLKLGALFSCKLGPRE